MFIERNIRPCQKATAFHTAASLASRPAQVPGETSPERILVPVSNPSTIEHLIDFALMIKTPGTKEPVIPFSVVRDDAEAGKSMANSQAILEKAKIHASGSDALVKVVTRIDVNTSSAISRASKELGITDIVIGWYSKTKAADRIFGTTLDLLLRQTGQNIFVCRLVAPLNVSGELGFFYPKTPNLRRVLKM